MRAPSRARGDPVPAHDGTYRAVEDPGENCDEAEHRSNPHHAGREPAASRRFDRAQPRQAERQSIRRKGVHRPARIGGPRGVAEICRRQVDLGTDVIKDGEFGKATRGPVDYGAWQSYAWGRIAGWEYGPARDMPQTVGRRDRVRFAAFYRELNQNSQTSTTP